MPSIKDKSFIFKLIYEIVNDQDMFERYNWDVMDLFYHWVENHGHDFDVFAAKKTLIEMVKEFTVYQLQTSYNDYRSGTACDTPKTLLEIFLCMALNYGEKIAYERISKVLGVCDKEFYYIIEEIIEIETNDGEDTISPIDYGFDRVKKEYLDRVLSVKKSGS